MSAADTTRKRGRSRATLVTALREGWRQSQGILAEMFEVPVSFGEPVIDDDGIGVFAADDRSWAVMMTFTGGSSGAALLVISRAAARPLVTAVLGDETGGSDDALAFYPTTVVELGNVVLNSVVAEAGRALDESYVFELPGLVSRPELNGMLESATATVSLVGEATVNREEPAPLGIGLLLNDPSWADYV